MANNFSYGNLLGRANLLGHGRDGGGSKGQQTNLFGSQDWADVDYLCSQYGLYQENTPQEQVPVFKVQLQQQQQQQFSPLKMLDDFQFDVASPRFQSPQQFLYLNKVFNEFSELVQPKKVIPQATEMMSVQLVNKSGLKSMEGEYLYMQQPTETFNVFNNETVNTGRLSTEEVLRVAGAQYIKSSVHHEDHFSMLMHPFGSAIAGLRDDETKDIQLAHLLFASAEKVGNQQYDRANRMLTQCDYLSSSIGSPVQRVVYYFAEALRERIFRETGRVPLRGVSMGAEDDVLDVDKAMMSPNAELLTCYQTLPFSRVLHFPGIQAIIDNVGSAKRVHLIYLGIKIGVPLTVLMQAIVEKSESRIEHLKITAIGTMSKEKLDETGKRLISFAESIGLPFSYKVVMVSVTKDVKEEMFEVKLDETVAICAEFTLRTMINRPDRLDSLMRVIRNLNPCIMVVTEVEGNHNSPSFFNRFIEALFFYGAYFDCLDACMDRKKKSRLVMERHYFGQGIMNMVATEGEERVFRHVGIDVWRAFFARFGWEEAEFSHSSMYQANLILKQDPCGSSCTIHMNGKCMTVGWKGTPLHSLSAWKLN